MRCAILPVFCKDTTRRSTITKAWIERLGAAIDAYFIQQSGGRAVFASAVFEWREIGLTTAEWLAAGALAGRKVYEAMADEGLLETSAFEHFVVLIDDEISSGGITPTEAPETSLIAAVNATVTLVAHEVGHRLKADHTFRDGPSGPIEYGGQFCIMGSEDEKHYFVESTLDLPAEGANAANARSGPGMCFANLVRAGWADALQDALRLKPYADGSLSTVVELAALDGAPRPGAVGLPAACVIELDDWYIVEYRSPTSTFDRQVPNNVPPGLGTLVLYASPANGPLVPLQVRTAAATPGNILTVGGYGLAAALAAATGGTPGLPLQLTVLSVGAGGRKISLRVERRLGKPPQFERTDDILDFLQWAVAGRDFADIERDSTLSILKSLAEIHHLIRMQRLAGPRDRVSLREPIQSRVADLQSRVGRFKA